MGKTVLVMGGSYFIGLKIVDLLVQGGFEVYTLNRGTKPNQNSKVTNLMCDREDEMAMTNMLKNILFDFVIDVSGLNKRHSEILWNSLNKQALKYFVFISSSAVYDVDRLDIPFRENDNTDQNKYWNEYGTNKIEAENYLAHKICESECKLVILRPPYIYGENNYAQRESFIFDHVVNNKPIIIPNQGNTKLQFIYTSDLANIIIAVLSMTLSKVSVFNVGNKKHITAHEWVELCGKVVGKEPIIMEFDYISSGINVRSFFPFFDYDNVLDVSKINQYYTDETDFEDGLSIAYKWYCKNKEKIVFKEAVEQNEINILKQLGNSI